MGIGLKIAYLVGDVIGYSATTASKVANRRPNSAYIKLHFKHTTFRLHVKHIFFSLPIDVEITERNGSIQLDLIFIVQKLFTHIIMETLSVLPLLVHVFYFIFPL